MLLSSFLLFSDANILSSIALFSSFFLFLFLFSASLSLSLSLYLSLSLSLLFLVHIFIILSLALPLPLTVFQFFFKVVALWKYRKVPANGAPFVYECTELISSSQEEEAMVQFFIIVDTVINLNLYNYALLFTFKN